MRKVAAAFALLSLILSSSLLHAGGEKKDPFGKGEAYFQKGDHVRALAAYRKALAENEVRAHYRMGLIYEIQKRLRDAMGHYRRFIELGKPGDERDDAAARLVRLEREGASRVPTATGVLERGRALLAEKNYRDAATALREAVNSAPENADAHYYLGEALLGLGEFEKAKAEFDRAKMLY